MGLWAGITRESDLAVGYRLLVVREQMMMRERGQENLTAVCRAVQRGRTA